MGLLGRFSVLDLVFPDRFRHHIRRRSGEIIGLILIAVGLALGISLLSWSSQDPSFNHAVNHSPHNLLGYSGAILSDFFMQIFGLASLLSIFLFMRWGWFILIRRIPTHPRLRVLSGFVSLFLGSGFASTLSVSSYWPLSSNMGGVFGDLLLIPIFALTSASPGPLNYFLIGSIFLSGSFFIFFFAIGANPLTNAESETNFYEEDNEDQVLRSNKIRRIQKDLGWWSGAFIHTFLGMQAQLSRLLPLRKIRHKQSLSRNTSDDSSLPLNQLTDGRIEPVFMDEDSDYDDFAPDDSIAADEDGLPDSINIETRHGKLHPARKQLLKNRVLRTKKSFRPPPLKLLTFPQTERHEKSRMSHSTLQKNAKRLEQVLQDFGVKGNIVNMRPGPVVTLYELEPAPGIKSSRVIGLADDISRSMSAVSTRVAVVPGRNVIGIELPNEVREVVYLRELLGSKDYSSSKARLPLALGKLIGGEPLITDLARMPHLLIAGTTGSGKSVGINTMILSLLYRLTPEQCRLIMIDPKMLELSIYDDIPHLLTPVVTNPKKAVIALKWTVREMEERYKKMSKVGVRNIDGFNQRVKGALKKGSNIIRTVQTGFDPETRAATYESEEMDLAHMPYLIVVIDEMADLMMVSGKDIEGAIQRLAQMARAAGIHLITATQRPSVDVITGTIKANFPTRISFQVTSKIDSRTILGEQGAEQLLGRGDMLYMAGGGRINRVHGPFVSDEEVEQVVRHLKSQGTPDYLEAVLEDTGEVSDTTPLQGNSNSNDLYDQAIQIILRDRKVSTSYIQRRLSIGYNRAATLIERMEQEGIISPANHAGKREILIGENMG